MSDRPYTETMNLVAGCGRTLLALGDNLDMALATVDRAEALGPFLDPTTYLRGGMDRLSDQAEFLHAAIALRDVCRRLQPKAVL